MPAGDRLHIAYSRELLLSLQGKGVALPSGLPPELIRRTPAPSSGTASRKRRRRGRRGGARQRLRKRGNKPPLPSIILSNVRSLSSEVDELRSNCRHCHEHRESCLMVFTASWLRQDIPDSLIGIEGFSGL